MKLKDGFVTHEMGDEQIMVSTGDVGFSGLVRSNPTAAFIVDCLKEETTVEAIVAKMQEKYDAPQDVLAADVNMIIEKLRGINALNG